MDNNELARQFSFECPKHRTPLKLHHNKLLVSDDGATTYSRIDGIWRLLPADRSAHFDTFIQEYERIRIAEGRLSHDPAYYRSLPTPTLTASHQFHSPAAWQQRATSFRYLQTLCATPLRSELKILDLGAGNGWLAYQFAKQGHLCAAVDLTLNAADGLGAWNFYDHPFLPIQAEFDALPFASNQFDYIIFNASLHYSEDSSQTIAEATRLLNPTGRLFIIDSPFYKQAESGRAMVAEREAYFLAQHQTRSNALNSHNYFTYDDLPTMAHAGGLRWELHWPTPAWRWRLRGWRAKLAGRREPAQFPLLSGERTTV